MKETNHCRPLTCVETSPSLRKKSTEKISSPIFFLRKGEICTQATGLLLGEIAKTGNKTAREWKGLAHSTTFHSLSSSLPSPYVFLVSSLPQERACSQVSLLQNKSMVTPIIFMTGASFQWKPNWQKLCSGFFLPFYEYIAKLDRAKMSQMAHIKTRAFTFCSIQKQSNSNAFFWFVGGHRAVTKISGCRVNTTSRQESDS